MILRFPTDSGENSIDPDKMILSFPTDGGKGGGDDSIDPDQMILSFLTDGGNQCRPRSNDSKFSERLGGGGKPCGPSFRARSDS